MKIVFKKTNQKGLTEKEAMLSQYGNMLNRMRFRFFMGIVNLVLVFVMLDATNIKQGYAIGMVACALYWLAINAKEYILSSIGFRSIKKHFANSEDE